LFWKILADCEVRYHHLLIYLKKEVQKMDKKFAGFIGGRGIGQSGVELLEENGFELVYIYGSRPHLATPTGRSADVRVGEKPNILLDSTEGIERVLNGSNINYTFSDDDVVVSAIVGSSGDPNYNYGLFIGSKDALEFITSLPVSYDARKRFYGEKLRALVAKRPAPITRRGNWDLDTAIKKELIHVLESTEGESWVSTPRDILTEAARSAWAPVMAADISRITQALETGAELYEGEHVFNSESLPSYQEDLIALRRAYQK